VRAARLLLTRWRELVAQKVSFGFESTLSGLTYAAMLREAKSQGYTINLCFLSLATVQHSIRRVRQRVLKGGHDVPLADLKRRFLPSLRNFFLVYLPLADNAALYDATLRTPSRVAQWQQSNPRILARSAYESILSRSLQEESSRPGRRLLRRCRRRHAQSRPAGCCREQTAGTPGHCHSGKAVNRFPHETPGALRAGGAN
jgi:predicted ABC-type ATPase